MQEGRADSHLVQSLTSQIGSHMEYLCLLTP